MGAKYHENKATHLWHICQFTVGASRGVPGKTDNGGPPFWGMGSYYRCAHFVLNSTSLQLIPAYSSQSSSLAQTLAAVGLSESEYAGVGW